MSTTSPRRGPRHIAGRHLGHIAGRHLGTIGVTLAVALAAGAIAAQGASAGEQIGPEPCVHRTFGPSDTYQPCVKEEQLLLNYLYHVHAPGPNQSLSIDGHYGRRTASDVGSFNQHWKIAPRAPTTTTPTTWYYLCRLGDLKGFSSGHLRAIGCSLFAS